VARYLVSFAHEWHWTPAQVWALELWQLVQFGRFFDRLEAERKRAADKAKSRKRG